MHQGERKNLFFFEGGGEHCVSSMLGSSRLPQQCSHGVLSQQREAAHAVLLFLLSIPEVTVVAK